MTRESNDRPFAGREMMPRPFRHALVWTTASWCVAAVIVASVLFAVKDQPILFGDALLIAVASLLISYASLLPGLVDYHSLRTLSQIPERVAGQRQSGMLVAGVVIRLIGTVALFLTCRYQMATPSELVAAMTIGWYVLLTLVDTVVLARELPRTAPLAAESATTARIDSATAAEI